jgi:hypothetical protein
MEHVHEYGFSPITSTAFFRPEPGCLLRPESSRLRPDLADLDPRSTESAASPRQSFFREEFSSPARRVTTQKTLYVDMDNVLVDFGSGIAQLDEKIVREFNGRLDDVPGIFALMQPVEGAVESFTALSQYFDTYVLPTSPWENPTAWIDKIIR